MSKASNEYLDEIKAISQSHSIPFKSNSEQWSDFEDNGFSPYEAFLGANQSYDVMEPFYETNSMGSYENNIFDDRPKPRLR